MVGEVRDRETAEIAIRVALTGHLVFSTLHTNDAPSGITRLLDIGIEPYLVASSVEAFIAQRLVRVICPHCKYEDTSEFPEVREQIRRDLKLDSLQQVNIYRGKGCPQCSFTGFYGRTGIYEILIVDEQIKEMIIKRSSSAQIKRKVIEKGMRTLRQDGWYKVISGITTPEEVMHITPQEKGLSQEEAPSAKVYSDRRVYMRLDAKVNVRYRLFRSEEEVSQKGFNPEYLTVTRNISAGGLLFIANEPLSLGSILEMNIELPGQRPVECLAKVVRVSQGENFYEIGVCLLDITSADRARLDKYVKERVGD